MNYVQSMYIRYVLRSGPNLKVLVKGLPIFTYHWKFLMFIKIIDYVVFYDFRLLTLKYRNMMGNQLQMLYLL